MKRRAKAVWPPPIDSPPRFGRDGAQQMRDGEPAYIDLHRFNKFEQIARGDYRTVCCDCGLHHLHVFELHQRDDRSFGIVMRTYRISADSAAQRLARRRREEKRRRK
jgi:hypothetical protein